MTTRPRERMMSEGSWIPRGQRVSDARWAQRHHAMLWALWLHLPFLWLLGVAYGNGPEHMGVDVAFLGFGASVATTSVFSRRVRTLVAVFTLVSCSAVLVHITEGLIESHFHFFAVVAFVTLYQQWSPLVVTLAYVVVHHGLVGVIFPAEVYNHQAAWDRPVLWAFIHGGFVLLASLASLVAWRLVDLERENVERVLDAAGDGIYGVDSSGRITFANPIVCELVGADRKSLEGSHQHEALGHRLPSGASVERDDCPVCTAARSENPLSTGLAALGGPTSEGVPVEYVTRPVRGQGSVITLRDLRERNAVEALRRMIEAERDQLASIAEAASDLTCIGHADGGLIWMNSAGRALLGFDPVEDLSAYSMDDLLSVTESSPDLREGESLGAREGSWQGTWTVAARDDTQIPMAVTRHVHRTDSGDVAHVSAIMRDLRPSLAQEARLRDSERRLAKAELVAGLGSWEWDIVSGEVLWSPGLYELAGQDPDTFTPSFEAFLATVHPDDRQFAQRSVQESLARGTGVDYVFRAVRPDGQVRVLHARSELTKDQHGRPIRMVGTSIDVTARHEATEALRESEARARGVIATAGDAYIQFGRDGLVTEWNQQAEKTFGWGREEAIGLSLSTLLPGSGDCGSFEHLVDLGDHPGLAPLMRERFDMELRRRSGREMPAEVTVWTIQSADTPAFGCFIRDISERQAVERAKNEFLSVVGHELRTPLTSIHGALGLLRAGFLGELNERGQHMVDIAAHNTDRLARLVNDILDLERLNSGKVSLQRQDCDVAVLSHRSADVMGAMAQAAGVHLEIEARLDTVWVDPDGLEQTLTNLLSNAIKFSPPGATVWLDARRDGDDLVVQVRDQGRGIPPEHLELIFDRFQQVDGSDARERGGTGLGLAICRTIVEQHGGHIWAESTFGEGATFTVTIPAVRLDKDLKADHGATVLVCGDSHGVRETLSAMLGPHGCLPVSVPPGALLLSAATHRPVAIMLDSCSVDSREAAAALRERHETCGIPLVLLSLDHEAVRTDSARTASLIGSPVDVDALVATLTTIMDGTSTDPTVLLVETDEGLIHTLTARLRHHGILVRHAPTLQQAATMCAQLAPDLLVLDLLLPDLAGSGLVAQLRRDGLLRGTPIAVHSGHDQPQSGHLAQLLDQFTWTREGAAHV